MPRQRPWPRQRMLAGRHRKRRALRGSSLRNGSRVDRRSRRRRNSSLLLQSGERLKLRRGGRDGGGGGMGPASTRAAEWKRASACERRRTRAPQAPGCADAFGPGRVRRLRRARQWAERSWKGGAREWKSACIECAVAEKRSRLAAPSSVSAYCCGVSDPWGMRTLSTLAGGRVFICCARPCSRWRLLPGSGACIALPLSPP
mmetsp:Transcript_23991/g.64901  ORF Transcript_23991/g.64901 Transcript_23991/m.64901 type:complete len:202 (+) Transcript_23991:537-1142(+)